MSRFWLLGLLLTTLCWLPIIPNEPAAYNAGIPSSEAMGPLIFYMRDVIGQLSLASLALALGGLAVHQLPQKAGVQKDNTILQRVICVLGLVYYPMVYGVGPIDPYPFGLLTAATPELPFAIFYMTLLIICLVIRQHLICLIWLISTIIAFHLKLLDSLNLWDYLLDPVSVIVSFCLIVVKSTNKVFSKK